MLIGQQEMNIDCIIFSVEPCGIVVSVQRCYAGDPGLIPGEDGDDGQYLHKPWSHPTKGVKTVTSPLCEDRMVPTVCGMSKNT